ncbi:hypothetical protein [Streptomyces omiyaensis]|uniref:hypothetical protein n=1 Tax=Streptomyces omiyaensis TaxID=68247 RepID=UPI0036FC31B0
MTSSLPTSQAEYEKRMKALENDAESARSAFLDARARYDRLCDEMRDLRATWKEHQKSAPPAVQHPTPVQRPATVSSAGLVMKSSAYPDRIKPHRGRHTHAAAYRLGLLMMRTACSKQFEEESVDHLNENDPITCPACQRAVQVDI